MDGEKLREAKEAGNDCCLKKSAFMFRFICAGRIIVDGMNASGMLLGDSVRLLSRLHDAPTEGRARGPRKKDSEVDIKQRIREENYVKKREMNGNRR